MAASDLLLTRSVELGYVQASSCVYIHRTCCRELKIDVVGPGPFCQLHCSEAGQVVYLPLSLSVYLSTSFSLSHSLPPFPPHICGENVAAQVDLQGCQIELSYLTLHVQKSYFGFPRAHVFSYINSTLTYLLTELSPS
jgi:hypothetical protein